MTESVVLTCDTVSVVFQKCGDRFGHQIVFRSADGTEAVLTSCEGKSDDDWPPSPALQSLHLETRPGGIQMAMLVGMAGRSHWSLCVEADPTGNRLLFDVACRIHNLPRWLGSTYEWFNQNGQAAPLDFLQVIAWPETDSVDENAVQIDPVSGSMEIPAPPTQSAGPQTIRWRYAVSPRISP